ncbi:hypothetical protein SNEBB_002627 [Seison nebaliae]|nr:hypothetical protein SNEBB_002627 [Seison nebaliae]
MTELRNILKFPYEELTDKRLLLDSLDIEYEKPEDVVLHGFNNPLKCGVCLTNAIFALIVSSELLMAQVRTKETAKKSFITKFMKNVKQDPFLEKKPPVLPLITQGDLLRDKLLRTSKGKTTHSATFGFAGEYYLLKSYLETICLNKREKPIPPGNKIESCYIEIRDRKTSSYPYEAWELILNDLFYPSQLTKKNFEFQHFKEGTYYIDINFLSLFWMDDNQSILKYKRLPPNLLYMLNDPISRQLTNYMEHLNLVPKHIALNFEIDNPKELHPLTFKNFFQCLDKLKGGLNKVDRFVCDDLTVVYDNRGQKLPLNFNQANFGHSFMFKGKEIFYKITGITFVSLYVGGNHLKIQRISRYYASQNPNATNNDLIECETNMFFYLMEYITTVRRRYDLSTLALRLEHDLKSFMRKICYYQYEIFKIPYAEDEQSCHFFTVTRRNKKWIILNDDSIINIEDEEFFWSAFKFEHVASILLVKTDQPYTLDPGTTISRFGSII